MTLTVIHDTEKLRTHLSDIDSLFVATFRRPLDHVEWKWLYGENPNGAAIVAMWHEGGRLVGHTALVPFPFSDGRDAAMAYRSGTTMVSEDAQQPGLLAVLGRAAQQVASTEGRCVFGFPNDNSWRGFQRFLKWEISEWEFVDLPGREVLARARQLSVGSGPWHMDLSGEANRNWRFGRPGVVYTERPGLVTSTFDGIEQILLLEDDGYPSIELEATYRVIIPKEPQQKGPEGRTYRFGWWSPRHADCDVVFRSARPQLIWSDVF